MSEAAGPDPPDRSDDPSWKVYVTDLLSSVAAVLLVGALLFAVSGVWPPLVAIESPSMNPNIHTGDLVFVMEEHRFPPEGAHGDTGVVTARVAQENGHTEFHEAGDVIVYAPNGNNETTPIIHRAMFWVEKNESWYDEADADYVGNADNCSELTNCPAPHAGFITKGDNPVTNDQYDQVGPSVISEPVRPRWVVGTAEARGPWLGCVRLGAVGGPRSPDACRLPFP